VSTTVDVRPSNATMLTSFTSCQPLSTHDAHEAAAQRVARVHLRQLLRVPSVVMQRNLYNNVGLILFTADGGVSGLAHFHLYDGHKC